MRHVEAGGISMFVSLRLRRLYYFEDAMGNRLTYERGYIGQTTRSLLRSHAFHTFCRRDKRYY